MSEESMTFGEALRTARCTKCGAEPGEDCRDSKPLPSGMHRVHTERLWVQAGETTKTAPRR